MDCLEIVEEFSLHRKQIAHRHHYYPECLSVFYLSFVQCSRLMRSISKFRKTKVLLLLETKMEAKDLFMMGMIVYLPETNHMQRKQHMELHFSNFHSLRSQSL